MRKICAMYDADEQYAYKFMNYVNDKRLMPYDVVMFTKKSLLEEYLKEERVELLLVAENTGCYETVADNVGRILYLTEEQSLAGEGIYKYQSADAVVKEVLKQCAKGEGVAVAAPYLMGNCRITGVYSPVGRCHKTTLALALAISASRQGKTLYINLEEFCGLSELVNDTGGSLSDLLYYFRHNQNKLRLRIPEIISSIQGFDYIPVCASPEDYEEVMAQEWMDFIGYLAENAGYENIILDIGTVVHEAWKLTSLCSRVYVPDVSDGVGNGKLLRFGEYMRRIGNEKLLEKMTTVQIPYEEELKTGNLLENLEWSSVGEFARRLMNESDS